MGYTGDKKREYSRIWVADRRKSFFVGKKCNKCGSIESLELHHVDPKNKVANSIWSWSKQRREDEIKKCIVLCNICHRKETLKQLSVPIIHGTHNCYASSKCRCLLCKNAQSEYMRRWRSNSKSSWDGAVVA